MLSSQNSAQSFSYNDTEAFFQDLIFDAKYLGLQDRLKFLDIHGESLIAEQVTKTHKRFSSWRDSIMFKNMQIFEQRLASDNLDEKILHELFAISDIKIDPSLLEIPEWYRIFNYAIQENNLSTLPLLPSDLNHKIEHGLVALFAPLITHFYQQLEAYITQLEECHKIAFDSSKITHTLLQNLIERITEILTPTLVLELNIARLQGELDGETAQARFESFTQKLHRHSIREKLFREYPVLVQKVTQNALSWLDSCSEFYLHLYQNWPELCQTFGIPFDDHIIALDSDVGDQHCNGRSVIIIKFSSGISIVYKPRSLNVDVHFQAILNWINKHSSDTFRVIKILNYENHGWVEFIEHSSCTTLAEAAQFYQQLGGYAALLYILRATDFHYENMIASGCNPVLIDLETLFMPKNQEYQYFHKNSEHIDSLSDHSILSTGLLPGRDWSKGEAGDIDVSGLGASLGQMGPKQVPYWAHKNTDQMQLNYQHSRITTDSHLPKIDDQIIEVQNFREDFIKGFTQIYTLIQDHRETWLEPEGLLDAFAYDQIRFLARDTEFYAILLQQSLHPNLLRDALEHDLFLDRLWIGVEDTPFLSDLIHAEYTALQRGDIPFLTTTPNTCGVQEHNQATIHDFFAADGLKLVRQRVQDLHKDDLAHQLWLIQASFTTLDMGFNSADMPTYTISSSSQEISKQLLIEYAKVIGNRLERLAFREPHGINWLGLVITHDEHWNLAPVGMDLYDGLPGIALFLFHLAKLTDNKRYESLGNAAIANLQFQLEKNATKITSLGGFNLWGGLIYSLTHLGMLLNNDSLIKQAESYLTYLPKLIATDDMLDIISGSAGCLAGVLALYRCTGSADALEVALLCGQHILKTAKPMAQGIAWDSHMSKQPLSGFSHGSAGIAWALSELYKLSGQECFKQAAIDAIVYERSLYVPESGNWLDLRDDKKDKMMVGWCHGAPGIGLARLQMHQSFPDDSFVQEVNVAIGTTLKHGFGFNHSLCHGALGNLELLLQAQKKLPELEIDTSTDDHLASILASIDKQGWLCGVPFGLETPGLMTGLSGIGYQLLRVVFPEQVPCVLTLRLPQES